MIKTFFILFIISIVLILFSINRIILLKKSVFYKYNDPKKNQLSNFDYLMDYNGNWLFKKIDFDKLYEKSNDEELSKIKQSIRFYETFFISTFILIMLFGIISKILGYL